MNWVITPLNRPSPRLQLFCFAQAGGGASTFFPWCKAAPEWLEISAIQLPGHETRMSEPLICDWQELIEPIASSISKKARVPCAFFGHSMGALLAYETSRYLQKQGSSNPDVVFLSGRNAPMAAPTLPPISQTSNEVFLEELSKRYAGIPKEILYDPEIRGIYLPILRNDIKLVETYHYTASNPLTASLYLYYGIEDDLVTFDKINGWQELTTGTVYRRELPGGHLYHLSHRNELLNILFEDLLAVSRNITQKLN